MHDIIYFQTPFLDAAREVPCFYGTITQKDRLHGLLPFCNSDTVCFLSTNQDKYLLVFYQPLFGSRSSFEDPMFHETAFLPFECFIAMLQQHRQSYPHLALYVCVPIWETHTRQGEESRKNTSAQYFTSFREKNVLHMLLCFSPHSGIEVPNWVAYYVGATHVHWLTQLRVIKKSPAALANYQNMFCQVQKKNALVFARQ